MSRSLSTLKTASFVLLCCWSRLSTCDLQRIDRFFDDLYNTGKLRSKPFIFDPNFFSKSTKGDDVYFRQMVNEYELYVRGNTDELQKNKQDGKATYNLYPLWVGSYPVLTYPNPYGNQKPPPSTAGQFNSDGPQRKDLTPLLDKTSLSPPEGGPAFKNAKSGRDKSPGFQSDSESALSRSQENDDVGSKEDEEVNV